MKNFSEDIVNKIKKEEIKPKSKWQFLLKDYFVWSVFGVTIVIGGLAFVIILFLLTNNDWDVRQYLNKGTLEYLIMTLPYFWIAILILFLFLASYNYRHTQKGYRYKAYLIVLGSIVASIVIGVGLFFLGLGEKIEQVLSTNLPYCGSLLERRMHIWNQPEKGLLAGKIINISGNSLELQCFNGDIWNIRIENTLWRQKETAEVGRQIKIIGEKESDEVFKAKEIRPWLGRHRRMEELEHQDGEHKFEHQKHMENEHRRHNHEVEND